MSRIDDMVAEICPVGVEFRELHDIFTTKGGYTPSKADKAAWTNGTVPWFRMEDIRENGGVLNDALQYINANAVKGGRLFPANSILIATSATIGEHALVTVPHLSNQRFTSLALKPDFVDRLDMKFVYYYCFILGEWCRNNTTISSFASVDMNSFKRFKFPVPPLAIQREIVAILDRLEYSQVQLEVELKRERECRSSQYVHYREAFLTPPEAADWNLVRLGDVIDLQVGYAFKSAEFTSEPGGTKLLRGDSIGQGFLKAQPFKRWMRSSGDGLDRYELRSGDVVLAMDRPWIPAGLKWARIDVADLPLLLVQRVARLRGVPRVIDQDFLASVVGSPAFTRYVLDVQSGNTVPHLSGSQIENYSFWLPPIADQIALAKTIRTFDALVNDLITSIKAEARARRQQFEYYRDRLLTFKEAV
ncbi:restriction endonuclease subunit S [Mycolicibacterium houstonense]|uniref:restriction endonuclease subunit S n=1 Tax=Mycolicibacterium houstonense TaxID=146021 RepID=UPI003F9AEC69